jgi:DNA-binding beta-propeller fold protein YncE
MRHYATAAVTTSLIVGAVAAGCGGTTATHNGRPTHDHAPIAGPAVATHAAPHRHTTRARRSSSPPLIALVTAQTQDRLLAVALPSGRVVRSVTVPGSPDYVAAAGLGGPYVVVSAAGWVTLLTGPRLHREIVLHGFGAPHIPGIVPGGGWAYVTDDARGQLDAIALVRPRVDSRTFVGAGAHHLAFSPDGQQVWVALGQSAATIVILSTISSRPPPPASPVADPAHPHIVARLHLGFLAHDLMFSPNGQGVWITSASGSAVEVFSARRRRLLFRIPAGPPPQHVVFAGTSAYITSGYGSQIERVSIASGRVLARVVAPYGSFDLDAAGRYVVTTSLFRGTIAIYNRALRLLRIRHIAPSTEDVAITQL